MNHGRRKKRAHHLITTNKKTINEKERKNKFILQIKKNQTTKILNL